jgi:putative ABC transport system permease protein
MIPIWFTNSLGIALTAISQNKLRSLLTALGIIFGVAAVIAMLAIGNGAKQSILDQLEIIGTNNIVITSIKPSANEDDANETNNAQGKNGDKTYSPGLHINDVKAFLKLIPDLAAASIEIDKNVKVLKGQNTFSVTSHGVNNDFFEINNLEIDLGSKFNELQLDGMNVCIIGADLSKRLFLGKNPVGDYVKSNNVSYKVVGVLKKRIVEDAALEKLKVSKYSEDIFLPVTTFFLRVEDRAYVSAEDVSRSERDKKITNYHQLDRVVLKVNNVENIQSSASLAKRILDRKHLGIPDYSIEVPELLIKQQQDTQETLNFVLAIIAGISLLVGGIGIMNIMLSSVLERVKEIGVRRSLGAKRKDVVTQFLLEAVLISLVGGIIGIILGILGARIIGSYADITAIVAPSSVILSFAISFMVGLFFGIVPAMRAAKLDPITAIRS